MLYDKVINATSKMVRDITDKGTVIRPVSGTPLSELVSAATPATFKSVDKSPTPEDMVKSVVSSKSLTGTPLYSAKIDEFVDLVSTAMATTIDIARNTVNPMISEFNAKVTERMNVDVEKVGCIDIVQLFLPKIYKNSALDELTSKYRNSNNTNVAWPENAWPAMEGSTIRAVLKPPVSRLADDLGEVLDHVDEDTAEAIYDYLFRNRPVDPTLAEVISDYLPIVGFLLSVAWLDDCPEDIGLSKEEIVNKLTELKAECGFKIQVIISTFERKLTQGIFIRKVPARPYTDKSIIVQGEIYQKWLEDGGTPELLIGAILLGTRPGFNIPDNHRKAYQDAFERDRKLREIKMNDGMVTLVMKVAKEFILGYLEDNANLNGEVVKERLQVHLRKHPYRSNICQNKWFRMLVCKVIFPNSNALQVLEGIDSIMSGDSTITAREAATLSAIDLMADWLCDSMDVERGRI